MSIRFSVAIAFALALTTHAFAQTPGTIPPRAPQAAKAAQPAYLEPATTGLGTFYRVYGKYQLSVSAAGKNQTKTITLDVDKPTNSAVVEKAFLMSAAYGMTIANDSVKLEGQKVSWFATKYNGPPSNPIFFHSGLADVTSIVKETIDAAPAGKISLAARENVEEDQSKGITGETLVVVFSTPRDKVSRSIVLLFGAPKLEGDIFEIALDQPIDPAVRGARADFGLGISFSYQLNGVNQSSSIDVNGKPLTRSAGGQDDGRKSDWETNGALITVGATNDKARNPANPVAAPTNPRADDERYSLLPFMSASDRTIRIKTANSGADDNIFFAWFDLSADATVGAFQDGDQDGDGLLDSWEIFGYDSDGDGRIDVDLPAMGADPKRKDLFIAYAWMTAKAGESASHQPTQAQLDAISAAFDRAPVPNPNGINGVKIHWRDLGSVAHDDDLNPTWTEFDAAMNGKLTAAELKIFRRMLNAHAYGGGGSSGIARNIPASDFIESLGKFSTNPGTFSQRAGTIMHELGHTLGLRHGGVDHENYKPNHLSVMSYFNQLDWVPKDGAPWLDYERFSLGDLDENALSEIRGLDSSLGDAAIAPYGVSWWADFSKKQKMSGADVNVDWNGNGSAGDNPVQADLNLSGGRSVLRAGFIEWDNLVFSAGSVGATADLRASFIANPETDLKELTEQEYLAMKRKTRKRD